MNRASLTGRRTAGRTPMQTHNEFRVAIGVSGGGTTMEAVIKAAREGRLPLVKPALIVASEPNIGAFEKARALGMGDAIHTVNRKMFWSSEAFGQCIINLCREYRVHAFCQYGWMPKMPRNVIEFFEGKMINQHPGGIDTSSGNGDFGGQGMYGKRVVAAQLYFAKMTGRRCCFYAEATAQRVDPDYDRGEVLRAWKVPVRLDDTVESLQARLLPVEHAVQIATLGDMVHGTLPSFTRAFPLIAQEERGVLASARERAIAHYPDG